MSSRSGGLLELVARGKKDVFFTANPVVSFFHSVYTRAAPLVKEVYVVKPRNIPEWGRFVDFDVEHRGDFVKNLYVRLELPTWLPAQVQEANKTGIVTDASGITFGYTNNIGFHALEKIQFFQDQVLLYETYGEYLDWRFRQAYPIAQTAMVRGEVGTREETSLAIGRSATPAILRIPIPLIGWQDIEEPGLPMVALRNQRFRIRIYLRPLEELIVASDGRIHPKPWGGKPLRVQYTKDGPIDDTHVTEMLPAMRIVGVSLESTQVYVPPDVQLYMKSQTIRIPYTIAQFQKYTIEDNQMTAAALSSSAFNYTMRLDCMGPVSRFLLGFRSEANTLAGQRTNLSAVPGTIRLNIANIDRVRQWSAPVFREVTSYWKNTNMIRDLNNLENPLEVYTVTFGGMDATHPSGTVNYTRAADPTLYITLNSLPYDERTISRTMFALLYTESWGILEIRNGSGKSMFDES